MISLITCLADLIRHTDSFYTKNLFKLTILQKHFNISWRNFSSLVLDTIKVYFCSKELRELCWLVRRISTGVRIGGRNRAKRTPPPFSPCGKTVGTTIGFHWKSHIDPRESCELDWTGSRWAHMTIWYNFQFLTMIPTTCIDAQYLILKLIERSFKCDRPILSSLCKFSNFYYDVWQKSRLWKWSKMHLSEYI